MSMVAKIFIVVNLLLAAFVLAFAFSLYGKNADWQYKYERERLMNILLKKAHVEEVIRLNAQVVRAEAERESLRWNINKQNEQILGLERQLEHNKAEMRTREQLVFALTTEVAEMSTENERLGRVINQRNQVINKLSDALTVSRANEANIQEENAATQMDNEDLSQQVTALENQTARLQEQLATANQKIQTLVALLGRNTPTQPMPQIKTTVQTVDPATQTVVLGVGKDDGVQAGFTFSVFHANNMVCRVKVLNVDQRMSVATYDGPLVTPNVHPQAGDQAATRLLGN
ncbi:MAG TPA: hypothetical protein VL860_14830 [Planctomycetota bacterium]|nr:hypothetical protein [Planctomycetota bacterium]